MGNLSLMGGYKQVPGRGFGKFGVQNCRRERRKEGENAQRKGGGEKENPEKEEGLEDFGRF